MDEMLNERTITVRKIPADGFDRYQILINGIKGLDGPILSAIKYNSDDVFTAISTLTVHHGPCRIVFEIKK